MFIYKPLNNFQQYLFDNIEFNNESEKHQAESYVNDINEKLILMGFDKLEMIVNEFNRTKIEQAINKDMEVKVKTYEPVVGYIKHDEQLSIDEYLQVEE